MQMNTDEVQPYGRVATQTQKAGRFVWLTLCVVILIWTAVYPFSRAFQLSEISYNEGWNVYNTQKVAEHQPLYPSTYDWTTVNYPALSFHLVAWLGKITLDYLFTARMLSLAGLCLSGVFAGLIVRHITRSKLAAWFSGLFLIETFCTAAKDYVGVDDPQILAQVIFLAGFYVYLRGNRKGYALDLTALLFVVGGNIKHNLIEFPLAVLLDLLFTSPRKAVRFAAAGSLMAAVSVVLTSRIDGAAYVSCLLAPRGYSVQHTVGIIEYLWPPFLLPAVAALWVVWREWKNPSLRLLVLLLFCALAVDTFFCGGSGITVNAMFGLILAIILLTGVFWAKLPSRPLGSFIALPSAAVCAIFFLWMAGPMLRSQNNNWRTDRAIEQSRENERNFAAETAILRHQPGPALCESLLLCYYAGKPYVYDPFNATRFIDMGRLDANVIVDRLRKQEYGAIQLDRNVEYDLRQGPAEIRFAPPILRAIQQYYCVGLATKIGIVYVPRRQEAQMRPLLVAVR